MRLKYCPKCGKDLKTLDKFCPNCGSLARENKKIQRTMFIFLFVAYLGMSMLQDMWREKNTNDVTEETSANVYTDYSQIFSDRNLEDTSDLERTTGRMYKEYASVDESGIVGKMEYCYTNDVILYVVETVYYPMKDFNRKGIEQFDSDIKDETKELDELNFVDITYEMKRDYYMLKIYYRYCDNPTYLSELYETGIVWWASNDGYVSARVIKNSLLEAGYVLN